MKKIAVLPIIMSFIMTSCADAEPVSETAYTSGTAVFSVDAPAKTVPSESSSDNSEEPVEQTRTTTESSEYSSLSEADTSESQTEASEADIPDLIFTDEDIFINSFECGYIPQDRKPSFLVIETEEQLMFAEDRYGLAVPPDLSEDELWNYNTLIADAFQEMKEAYPIDKYSYAVEYAEVSCGGYYLHADKLAASDGILYFIMDDESYTPNDNDEYPAVMGGFCHMAAVPKELLENTSFLNVIYPDKNDLSQDINYSFDLTWHMAGSELYDVYGDTVYLISSQEEFEEFLSLSDSDVLRDNLSHYVYHLSGELEQVCAFDLGEVSAAILFFTTDDKYPSFKNNGVKIENGSVVFDYELSASNPGKYPEPQTCMVYVTIPKRFLD